MSIALHISGTIHEMISFMVLMCKTIISSHTYQFQSVVLYISGTVTVTVHFKY